LDFFGHKFSAKNRRSTQKALDLEEIQALKRTIEIKDGSIKALQDAHSQENKARDRASSLERQVTKAYIDDAADGYITKIPVEYKGKGWSGIIATTLKAIPDNKVPGLNQDTKNMIGGLIEDNKEVVEQLAPLLMGTLFQNLPEETKKGLMSFLTPGVKEKGK